MTNIIPITRVVNVSVSQAQLGLSNYNTSNIALFTSDTPTSSDVTLTFSDVAVSGTFILKFGTSTVAAINWDDTAGQIQTKVQAVPALANITVSGSIASKTVILSQAYPYGEIPGPVTVPSLSQLLLCAVTATIGAVDADNKTLTYSTTPTAGGYNLVLGAFTAAIVFGDNAAAIQVKVRALDASLAAAVVTGGPAAFNINNVPMPATSTAANTLTYPMASVVPVVTSTGWSGGANPYAIYFTATDVATDFASSSATVSMATAIFSQQPNILNNGGYLVVIPFLVAETLDEAIDRTSALVSYFGVLSTVIDTQVNNLAAARKIQTLNMIGFFASNLDADIGPSGSVGQFKAQSLSQSRGLFYKDTTGSPAGISALNFAAGYAGRGLSVNFSGSNTTITMNLKPISGLAADPNITNTLLSTALDNGVDTYVSLQGVPAVLCSGGNFFYDEVYNLRWFVGALQIAMFNYLAQSSTKIPQTESGMDGLKGSAGNICEQAVSNQYAAPGTWTSPDTFGNQANFYKNIQQFGYYIYSSPIASQSAADRAARKAPLIQIAIKEAGAIQSANVLVYVNP